MNSALQLIHIDLLATPRRIFIIWEVPGAAFCITALLGAYFGGNTSDNRPHDSTAQQDRQPAESLKPRWTRDDFLEKGRLLDSSMRQTGYNPLADELADWSNAEIITALDDCLHNPDVIIPGGSGFLVDHYLFDQLLLRDFDSGLEWFEQVESRPAQARLSTALSFRWPADQGEQGLSC